MNEDINNGEGLADNQLLLRVSNGDTVLITVTNVMDDGHVDVVIDGEYESVKLAEKELRTVLEKAFSMYVAENTNG